MKYGTGFALTKMGLPTSDIVDFTQSLEGAGINYMTFAGHALSAAPDRYAGRPGDLCRPVPRPVRYFRLPCREDIFDPFLHRYPDRRLDADGAAGEAGGGAAEHQRWALRDGCRHQLER